MSPKANMQYLQPAYPTSTELRKPTRCQVLAFCALKAAKAKVKPRPTQKARRFDQLSLHAASGHACFGHRGTTRLPVDRRLKRPGGTVQTMPLCRAQSLGTKAPATMRVWQKPVHGKYLPVPAQWRCWQKPVNGRYLPVPAHWKCSGCRIERPTAE